MSDYISLELIKATKERAKSKVGNSSKHNKGSQSNYLMSP